MTTPQIIWCLSVFAAAAFVQSIGGFGFSLFAVPLMALSIPLPEAVVAGSIAAFANVVVLSARSLRDVEWTVARRFNLPALVGMPLGLLVLVRVDESVLKVALGAVIIVLIVVLIRTTSATRPRPVVEVVAGLASGVLATSTSTNGPPLVFAAQLRGLPPETFRATLSFSFALQGAISLVAFFAAGEATQGAVLLALGGLPLIAAGQWLGIRTRPRVHGKRFDRMVYGLLALSAVSVSWSGFFG
ncbi:MAG: sulfite exporter TauE/SafE family protein [Acidimicrobiia bacterium]|nr:sulfite exporter TauE/SafE family protein [Acidimicrobiia bacterium]